jgi:hypothetical protein
MPSTCEHVLIIPLLAAGEWGPSLRQWLLLGALGAVGVAILVVGRMRRGRLDGSPRHYRREIDSANRDSVAIRNDLSQLLDELDRLSRRIDAQIDQRYSALQQAITDADQRISALRILLHAAREGAAEPGPAPSPPGQTPPPADSTVDPRARRIYQLADEGLTPVEIARRLEEPAGEVELILNLRHAGERAGRPRAA